MSMTPVERNYMPEERILGDRFIFVSYSHKEYERVSRDVADWNDKGVRIWFDRNMQPSDDWKKVANEKINHPNCVGVLFYNSDYSLASSACAEERRCTLARLGEGDFRYWFINKDEESTDNMARRAWGIANENGESNFLDRISDINKLFNDNILRIREIDDAGRDYLQCMIDMAEQVGAIDTERTIMKGFGKRALAESSIKRILLGRFIDKKQMLPIEHEQGVNRFVCGEQEYICYNDSVYSTKPLFWRFLYNKSDVAVLLCDEILLDAVGTEIDDRLAQLEGVIFSEKERNNISAVRLLTTEDIQAVQEHDKDLLSEESGRHYWINGAGLSEGWQMTCLGSHLNKKGFPSFNQKGVRPVIEIPTKNIESIAREE